VLTPAFFTREATEVSDIADGRARRRSADRFQSPNRYGAMQTCRTPVFGRPRDRAESHDGVAEAVDSGVEKRNAGPQYYGPEM